MIGLFKNKILPGCCLADDEVMKQINDIWYGKNFRKTAAD